MRASIILLGSLSPIARPIACAAMLVSTAAAAPERIAFDPYARGDELSRKLMEGDVAAIEQAMTPAFLARLGGRTGLARLVEQLRAQAGAEMEVLRRAAYSEVGRISYYRVSRFERTPSLTIRWVFDGARRVEALSVRPTLAPASNGQAGYRTSRAFHLPFAAPPSGHWYVAWGGDDQVSNKHAPAPDQRFAYDFVVTHGREIFRSDGGKNEDHHCWNEPVYAPSSGTVVQAIGDVPDNAPGVIPPTAPPAGNHVVIDHGNNAYSIIAHFRLGSLAVRVGQIVTERTLIGRCGNSGRSELPHVHYHLQNRAAYGEGEGLPVTFGGYFTGGVYVPEGRPVRGEYLLPSNAEAAGERIGIPPA